MANSNRFSARHGLDNNSKTIQNVADPINAMAHSESKLIIVSFSGYLAAASF